MLMHAKDEELVLFYAGGNDYAFEELQSRYREWIVRAFLHDTFEKFNTTEDDAEDFAQDFFISLADELKEEHEFEPGMFEHWLKKRFKHDLLDWIRRHPILFLPIDEETALVPDNNKPKQTDFWTALGNELRKLPQRERLIFILHHFKKWKFREIAARLHTRTNDMSKQYVRILEKLKKSPLRFFL